MAVNEILTAIGSAGLGAFAVIGLLPSAPVIDIKSVHLDVETQTVFYERVVNQDDKTRATVTIEVVDTETEKAVEVCERVARATFGPEEDRVQQFSFAFFTSPQCWDALTPGAEYQIVAVVSDEDHRSDVQFSIPWTQPEQEGH